MSKKKFKNYKVYIIGNFKSYKSEESKEHFLKAEKTLKDVGFVNIINPFESEPTLSLAERKRENYNKLLDSNAVYILSNVAINGTDNTELQIAKDLNLIIIHDHI